MERVQSSYTQVPQDDSRLEFDEYQSKVDQRPKTYYNDGEFSAPSSDDEPIEKDTERDAFLDEDEDDLEYTGSLTRITKGHPTALRTLLLALSGLVLLATVIGIFAAQSYNGTYFKTRGKRPLSMDHVFNGTFSYDRKYLDWVPEAGDGVFSVQIGGDIVLVNLDTGTNKTLMSQKDVNDEHGRPLVWNEWKLCPDMKYVLLKTDRLKQWRHSSFGNYYLHNLDDHSTKPIMPPSSPPVIAYAQWAPVGHSVAFVTNNDIYLIQDVGKTLTPIQITFGGNSSLFHGVPDWVYEEEVFSSDFALWWSPDALRVAYLRLDETKVNMFEYPIYNPSTDSHEVHPYPERVSMRYPKPGFNNPLVSVHIFSLNTYNKAIVDLNENKTVAVETATQALDWESKLKKENSIITEVTWVANNSLILKEVTRSADAGNVVFFNFGSKIVKGQVVRTLGEKGEEGDDGWIDSTQSVYPLTHPISVASLGTSAYLDILPTREGYNHIALFTPADSRVPRWLTSGDWEVSDPILKVDPVKGLVYFGVASKTGINRHVYAVPLPSAAGPEPTEAQKPSVAPTPLTDESRPGYYVASFSPGGRYYVLDHLGPLIPWQKLIQTDNSSFEYTLSDNLALNLTNEEFQAPVVIHSTIDSEGYELNVKELRPPGMDDSGRVKYPVLFYVYGGPGSQLVNTRFGRDWHDYLVCNLKYIVVIVDGRGTGFKGRRLRNPVRGNLGFFETVDQINAAKIWATKRYVDSRRIGIWGWSYGGFMTGKVIEANAGIHSLGMSVAPVVSWLMYDSIYTERYMRTPQLNPDGYINASITNVTGFNNVDFLLAHGSGDDNVHFANSAHLLDMFTQDHVQSFRFRMFTDSNHRIVTRGANRELYEWMTSYLIEKWGKGPLRRS
ncbi:dipeptidyl aminopeptidase [Cantharellus anzutake]|uniref:dipeptidyl aminopeptidase n=1 Tax=Cantharellus anzutake TaxID=1750568 RepID=UPI001904CF24|nr:dipeptidyl aminopeptidase [Cantharellus anzutake]KAF8323522.1 dipeptidyl aminopeptidase [Cantharellus anzutake]